MWKDGTRLRSGLVAHIMRLSYPAIVIVLGALGLVSGFQWVMLCRRFARLLKLKQEHLRLSSVVATVVLIITPSAILWNQMNPGSRRILQPFLGGLIAAEVLAQLHGVISPRVKRRRMRRSV